MKLEPSKKKLPETKKDLLKSSLMGFFPTIHKNQLNTESYKTEQKPTEVTEKPNPLLESIKKDTSKLFSFINNIKNLTKSSNSTTNVKNNSSYFDFNHPRFITNNKEQRNNKSIDISLSSNIDKKTIFKPSMQTLQEINEKFNTNISKENILNITKRPAIPAMQKGGVVKQPTVSYLHENEAVIPLKDSKEFSNTLKIISNETKNNISKNERINNTSEMRNFSSNRSMTSSYGGNNNSKKENNSTFMDNRSMPVIMSGGGGKDTLEAKIPTVYAGSASTSEFFVNSARIPSWRSSIG
jgi:hypothetical protein